MAITAETRTDIIDLVVAALDVAPGTTLLNELVALVDGGGRTTPTARATTTTTTTTTKSLRNGVHHANAVVWEPVTATATTRR